MTTSFERSRRRQVAARVERAHVAGPQPAVAQRLGRGGGVAPVAGHHDVAAADDLADLARRERPPVGADDRDLDAAARPADRAEDRLVGERVVGAAQARDRHRRLALAVDLREHRAEGGERLLQLLDVHRPAAVDDAAQVRRAAPRRRGGQAQPLHHGRREEGAAARMRVAQIEELVADRSRPRPGSPAARRAPHRRGAYSPEPCDIGAAWIWLMCSSSASTSARCAIVSAIRLRCDSIAPFERPVVPLV